MMTDVSVGRVYLDFNVSFLLIFQVNSSGFTKRFKKNRKKKGFKHVGKVNGK